MKFNSEYVEPRIETTEKLVQKMNELRDKIGEVIELKDSPVYGFVSDDIQKDLDAIDEVIGEAYNLFDVGAYMLSHLEENENTTTKKKRCLDCKYYYCLRKNNYRPAVNGRCAKFPPGNLDRRSYCKS